MGREENVGFDLVRYYLCPNSIEGGTVEGVGLRLANSHIVTDTSSLVNRNAYMASSSAPQIDYDPMVQQSSEYSLPEVGLVVPVFQKGDDPIDAINHMMSFLTAV
nr:hypothetical protein [Tanacetum cinerariifolium]